MLNLTASHPTNLKDLSPRITVVGVGGAGCNAVNNMIASKLEGVQFLSCNTDAQALSHALAPTKIQLGTRITAGLGAGSKPDIGRAAAEESIADVMAQLEGSNMVFITAGMGGGTGTGAAPVIARAAKEAGILTVGVVTKPFHFEGANRMRMAEAGLSEMQDYVDTLIVIPNQNLFRIANERTTFAEAFKLADSVLQSGVRGVTDLMVMPGLINLDFADIRSAMMEMGKAMMGTGEANGDRRAVEAAERAINNPLLDDISMKGAKGVIINITGGYDMTLFEVDEACNRIRDEVDADANIIFGSTFDDSLEGVMRVTVLATGIEAEGARRARPIRAGNGNTIIPVVNAALEVAGNSQRPERAQPTASLDGLYGSMTGMQSHLVVPPMSQRVSAPSVATAQSYVTEGNTARKMDMGHYQPEMQQASPAQAASAADLSRGMRFGSAFIPPRPVDPEMGRAFAAPAATQAATARMPVEEDKSAFDVQPYARPQGLHLQPPVPGAKSKKRTPSLFERLAGMFTEHDDEAADDEQGTTSGQAGGEQLGLFAGFAAKRPTAAPLPEASGFDVDVPVQSQPATPPRSVAPAPVAAPSMAPQQQDLEIPAFLRRQVS